MKRQKEVKTMLSALATGDEVVTAGGLLGTLTKISEQYVSVQLADGVEVSMQKAAITAVLPKGTLKSI
jgi:preprotein translocase subunit YajC